MNNVVSLTCIATLLLGLGVFEMLTLTRQRVRRRLFELQSSKQSEAAERAELIGKSVPFTLEHLTSPIGRAGFLLAHERIAAQRIRVACLGSLMFLGALSGFALGPFEAVIGSFVGLYLGLLFWVLAVKQMARTQNRLVMFQLPIVLEGIILLVESGLGILPAIERLVNTQTDSMKEPVTRLLRMVYNLSSHGLLFGDALRLVGDASPHRGLRHVFVHLDVSNSEGGELVPALRSLSNHCHSEWKLSVEGRVRRLETLVVFPVFASVIGLMLVSAAVPMIPVFEFLESLETPKQSAELSLRLGSDSK